MSLAARAPVFGKGSPFAARGNHEAAYNYVMRRSLLLLLAICLPVTGALRAGSAVDPAAALDAETAARFARLALDCVQREYPNKVAHVLQADGDAKPPRELTPAFFGCYDWHSAVHGHWLLARLARRFPGTELAAASRAALRASLTPDQIAGVSLSPS